MSLNTKEQVEAFLPPIELLQKYEELGMGEDLIKLVTTEQKHRLELQKKYFLHYRFGQLFSFLLSAYFCYNVFELIKLGNRQDAYILFGIFVFLLCFVYVNSRKDKNLQHKNVNKQQNQKRFFNGFRKQNNNNRRVVHKN